jgi:hypothetical protein
MSLSHEHLRTLYIDELSDPVPASHAMADGLIDGYDTQGGSFCFAEGVEAKPVVSPGLTTQVTYEAFSKDGLGSPK